MCERKRGGKKSARKRDIQREREREGERGQLSILRHDFSEDTAACCDYWVAAKRRDIGRKRVRERA